MPLSETGGDANIVTAANDDHRDDEKTEEERRASGLPLPAVEGPFDPLDGLPAGYGGAPAASEAAPAGGRLGSASTRALNAAIADHLEAHDYTITHGGGQGPEEYIPGPGPRTLGSTYVDITAQHNTSGDIVRVQTIDTLADGSPTPREVAAAAKIQLAYPDHTLRLIRKK